MKLDIGGRGSGKSTRILQWMNDAPEGVKRIVVCHDHSAAMGMLRSARSRFRENNHLESWQFIGVEELRSYNPFPWGRFEFEFAVDQMEIAFQNLFSRYRIALATVTDNDLPRGLGPEPITSALIPSSDVPPELFVARVTYRYADVVSFSVDHLQQLTVLNLGIDSHSLTWVKAIYFPSLTQGLGFIDIDLMAPVDSKRGAHE